MWRPAGAIDKAQGTEQGLDSRSPYWYQGGCDVTNYWVCTLDTVSLTVPPTKDSGAQRLNLRPGILSNLPNRWGNWGLDGGSEEVETDLKSEDNCVLSSAFYCYVTLDK